MPDNEAVVQARPRTSALGSIKIAKLKETDNYQIWKYQVENLLRHERLWKCINPRDGQGNYILTGIKLEDDEDARTTINLLLESQYIMHVKNATTARDAWANLNKQYENKCWSRRINLQTELWKLLYEECSGMREYLDKIKSLTQQFADIDAPVEDSWLVSIIMRGLPKQFDGIVQILDNTKETVTSEDIMEKLMHESLRQQTRDSTRLHLRRLPLSQSQQTRKNLFLNALTVEALVIKQMYVKNQKEVSKNRKTMSRHQRRKKRIPRRVENGHCRLS